MRNDQESEAWQLNQGCIRNALQIIENLPLNYGVQHVGKQLFKALCYIGVDITESRETYEDKEYAHCLGNAIRSAVESDHWLSTLENLSENPNGIGKLKSDNAKVIKILRELRRSIEEKGVYTHASLSTH